MEAKKDVDPVVNASSTGKESMQCTSIRNS